MTVRKMPLKVYHWIGFHRPIGGNINRRQSREVVAATSQKKAAALYSHYEGPRALDMTTTENEDDVAIAMSEPGTIFWKQLDSREKGPESWTKAPPLKPRRK